MITFSSHYVRRFCSSLKNLVHGMAQECDFDLILPFLCYVCMILDDDTLLFSPYNVGVLFRGDFLWGGKFVADDNCDVMK